LQVAAVIKISAPAFATGPIMAAVPTDADALTFLPRGNAGTQFVDDARHFVPRNARILNSGPQAFFRQHVAVANPAGLNLELLSKAHLLISVRLNVAIEKRQNQYGALILDIKVCNG
jgi:hypothetical protein